MAIVSPCINVCVTDPESDLCYGCARTTAEITKWSSYSDKEQTEVVEASMSRMDGWQLPLLYSPACNFIKYALVHRKFQTTKTKTRIRKYFTPELLGKGNYVKKKIQ